MAFELRFSTEAAEILEDICSKPATRVMCKKVRKALGLLETDPRHRGLNSHQYQSLAGPAGEPVWESYVESQTPGAWRIWWWYGSEQGQITVLTIGPHPD